MTTTRYIIIFVLVSLAIILAGCRLSASTPPPTTETPDAAMGTLEAELGNIATQTHVAAGGDGTPAETQAPEVEPSEPPPPDASPVPTEQVTEPPPPPQQPTSTPAEVPPATPGIPSTYQLVRHEFPFCIARRFNVNQNELLSINGLSTSSVVPVGFTLKIPQSGNSFAGQRSLMKHPDTYTVVAGDTIHKVACKYGSVDPLAIAQANELKPPYNLSSGQVLHIP